MKKIRMGLVTGAAAMLLAAVPSPATAADSCTLGSPNIARDVTECIATLTAGCAPLSSPNILADLLDCLPR